MSKWETAVDLHAQLSVLRNQSLYVAPSVTVLAQPSGRPSTGDSDSPGSRSREFREAGGPAFLIVRAFSTYLGSLDLNGLPTGKFAGADDPTRLSVGNLLQARQDQRENLGGCVSGEFRASQGVADRWLVRITHQHPCERRDQSDEFAMGGLSLQQVDRELVGLAVACGVAISSG